MPASTSLSSRFKELRERAGLSRDEVARLMGISAPSVWDIESFNDELFSCYSPAQVKGFCQVLGVQIDELLGGASAEPPVAAAELARLIHEQCRVRGVSLEQFEDAVGWRLGACIEPPERLLKEMTVDGLQWLCRELGIDWRRVMLSL